MATSLDSSRQSGGRIITQNAELLSLLTERTQSTMNNNSPLQKIYVDSPAYEEDDDDRYKYVSTNVDDFDETQMAAFMVDKPPLDQLVETTGLRAQGKDDEDEDDTRQRGFAGRTPRLGAGQYRSGETEEDDELRQEQEYQAGLQRRLQQQNQDDQKFSIPRLDLSEEEDNPRDSLDPTLGGLGGGKLHEINIRDSLEEAEDHQRVKDQERLRLLMDETDPQGFQVIMGENLHQPSRDNTMQNPLKINLNGLEETPEPGRTNTHPQPVQNHQLADDPRLRNMFENQQQLQQQQQGQPSPYQQGPYYETIPAEQHVPPPHHSHRGQNGQYQLPPPNQQGPDPQEQSHYLPPHQQTSGPSRGSINTTHLPQNLDPQSQQQFSLYQQSQYGPAYYDNPDSRAPPQHYQAPQYVNQQGGYYQAEDYQGQQFYQQGPPHPPQMYDRTSSQQQYAGQQPNYEQQVYQNPPPQPYYNQQPLQNEPQVFRMQSVNPNPYYNQPQNLQDNNTDQQFDEESGASSPSFSETPKKEKPKIDFLSRNKKDYSKAVAASKNSYTQAYSQRKKVKENLPPAPAQGTKRGPVRAKHPPQLKKDDTSETFIVEDTKPGTAETLWSKRSQNLANTRKDARKGQGSGGKKNKRGTLQKYPSESRVDEMKTVSSAPPKLIPIKGSPRQAFTEPLRSEVDVHRDSGKPLRHTVFTDDGQRVSVDINLKLSPGGYAPGGYMYQPGIPQPPPMAGMTMLPQYHQPPPPPLAPGPHQDQGQWNGYYYQPPLAPQQVAYHRLPQQEEFEQFGHQQAHAVEDRGTPMSQRSAKPPSPIGSPFKVLPPIGSADSSRQDTGRRDGSLPDSGRKNKSRAAGMMRQKEEVLPPKDNSSYLDQMRRAKERKPVEFRQYTVEDYKKLKREVRLGGLGPDLDNQTLKERRDKRERQQEYAKQVNSKNKTHLESAPKVTSRPPAEDDDAQADLLHRRRVAIEYAKSVPKPKVRPPGQRRDSGNLEQGSRPESINMTKTTVRVAKNKPPGAEADMLDLETLRRRHEEEKQQAALIRQQVQAANM